MKKCKAGMFSKIVVFIFFAVFLLPMTVLFLYLIFFDPTLSHEERLLFAVGVVMFGGLLIFAGYRVLYLGLGWVEYDEETAVFHVSRREQYRFHWEDIPGDRVQASPWLGGYSAEDVIAEFQNSVQYDLWYLSGSAWGEGPAACECGWDDETIPFTGPPKFLKPAQVGQWDGQSLENEAVWLHGLLSLLDDEMIAPVIPLVYGFGVCPKCGRREPYWVWMDRFVEG